jgi:cytochrome oxidase Cu insertion factor (SCO1/SenC/PrrC family)
MQTIEFRAKVKNGIIHIPARFKGKVADDVQVILVSHDEKNPQPDIIDQLMEKPLKVKGFQPLTRDEAHARA